MLVAVDPGVHATGIAVFNGQTLMIADLVQAETLEQMISRLDERVMRGEAPHFNYDRGVIERPTVYSKNSKGDPNDLIRVAIVAGAAAVRCFSVRFVEPRTWKGQVPKAIHNRRVVETLSPAELAAIACIQPKSLQHNALDAVG